MSVVLWNEEEPLIEVVVWETAAELRTGSFVMILMVPAMAEDPKRAEPPPLIISTLSIMFAGNCSIP